MAIDANKHLSFIKKRRDGIRQKECPGLLPISEDSEGSRVNPVNANEEADCVMEKKAKPKVSRSIPARLASVMRRLRDSYISCLQKLDGVGDMRGLAGGGHTMGSPTAAVFHRKPTDWNAE